jgi:prophage maintenance system killer protein
VLSWRLCVCVLLLLFLLLAIMRSARPVCACALLCVLCVLYAIDTSAFPVYRTPFAHSCLEVMRCPTICGYHEAHVLPIANTDTAFDRKLLRFRNLASDATSDVLHTQHLMHELLGDDGMQLELLEVAADFVEKRLHNTASALDLWTAALRLGHDDALSNVARLSPIVAAADRDLLLDTLRLRDRLRVLSSPRDRQAFKCARKLDAARRERFLVSQALREQYATDPNDPQGIDRSGTVPPPKEDVLGMDFALTFVSSLVRQASQTDDADDMHESAVESRLWDWQVVRDIHKHVLGSGDAAHHGAPGELRVKDVIIGNTHQPPPARLLPGLIEQLFHAHRTCNSTAAADAPKPSLSFAFDHGQSHIIERTMIRVFELLWIHPFADGNGRTSQILMAAMLSSHGFPLVAVAPENRERFNAALAAAHPDRGGAVRSLIRLVASTMLLETKRAIRDLRLCVDPHARLHDEL